MAYGDVRYEFHAASNNATNSSNPQNFFGSYSGLSLLNNEEVIHIQVSTTTEFFLATSDSGYLNSQQGYKVYPSLSQMKDLYPMRAGTASLLQAKRQLGDAASANNASWNWVVWRRLPL